MLTPTSHLEIMSRARTPEEPAGHEAATDAVAGLVQTDRDSTMRKGVRLGTLINRMKVLYAEAPTVQPLTEKQDAARYRWLRHGDNDEKCIGMTMYGQPYMLRGELLDRCIDEAIAADAEESANTVTAAIITAEPTKK